MKKLLFTFLFLTLGTAWGGAFEDGRAAFGRFDYVTAAKFYRLAAEQGNAQAQVDLGVMLANGTGIVQDLKEATKWYRLAVAQGYPKAQFELGNMYFGGGEVLQDYKEAARLYRLAAEQGYVDAQSALGMMYAKGQGVTRDYARAHMWWNIAGAPLTKDRDSIAEKMTPQQIEKAQEMAKACQASNFKGC